MSGHSSVNIRGSDTKIDDNIGQNNSENVLDKVSETREKSDQHFNTGKTKAATTVPKKAKMIIPKVHILLDTFLAQRQKIIEFSL